MIVAIRQPKRIIAMKMCLVTVIVVQARITKTTVASIKLIRQRVEKIIEEVIIIKVTEVIITSYRELEVIEKLDIAVDHTGNYFEFKF